MVISLSSRNGKLTIQPDPALVHVGDKVVFVLEFERATWATLLHQRYLRWTVYFQEGNPFRHVAPFEGAQRWSASGTAEKPGQVELGKAEESGEYKYGVEITDSESGAVISDDDPMLVVLV